MSTTKPQVSADEQRWQSEHDMRVLIEAEQIKRDPKRLARARQLAKQQLSDLQKAAGTPATTTDKRK